MAAADRRNQVRRLTAGVRDRTVPGRPASGRPRTAPDRGPIEARTRAWAIVRPIRMDAAAGRGRRFESAPITCEWPRRSGR